METINIEKKQSLVIEAMRFPLIFLVLVIHILPQDLKPLIKDFSSMAVYRFISEMISHNIGRIAVPCFFVFSGYFFFRKMESWSANFYFTQLKKRVNTLLVPYLLWNLLLILVIYLKAYTLSSLLSMDQSEEFKFLHENSFFELFWMPVDLPLWFLRDLICMTVLTPLFYYLFKYTKVAGLLAILAAYLIGWNTNITGVDITAILYFGAGAYFGLYKKNMLEFCNKVKVVCFVAFIPLLLLSTFYNGIEPQHEHVIRFFLPVGVITAFNVTEMVIENEKIRKLFIKFSPTVLFIFAIHEFYLKNWLKGAFYRTPLADTGTGMLIGYFVMPLLLLIICLGLYYLWERISPRTLAVLSGGRIPKAKMSDKND